MRWAGFRKVRRQVCKRIDRRVRELGLAGVSDYQAYLEKHPGEWTHLDSLCRITISRFYRDKKLFEALADDVLPELASAVTERGDRVLRVWSAGCASGEEAYTVAILWEMALRSRYPEIAPDILATDADGGMISRAREAVYAPGSLKEIPAAWREKAFVQRQGRFVLEPGFRRAVRFEEYDIRTQQPAGPFDLVLCRNLAFTYFDDDLQLRMLRRLFDVMRDGAALVIGVHEHLPDSTLGLCAWTGAVPVFRKIHSARQRPAR